MQTIYYRNTAKIENLKAVLYNTDESSKEIISLSNIDDDGDYIIEFDDDRYDHIEFIGDNFKKSDIVYPGAISIGIKYKKNEALERELTYLFDKGIEKTGRVDNYILEDVKNLAHRNDKSKKVSVFLPTNYDGTTPHDILYFFDAQNLFYNVGEYTTNGDPYGSWQLDVILSAIHRQYGKNIIVVGIDNADEYRSQELFMNCENFGVLSPLATAMPEDDFSKGYLDGLSNFMIDTLHPFIKEKYCICEDNIGIGGSSMGGIAAFYCSLKEMGFYKYVLSYSPAYALYEMSAFENYFVKKKFNQIVEKLPKIHIYCGEGDPLERLLVGASRSMKETLVKYGYPKENIFETYDIQKPHNEESWRLILGDSFTKLLDLG